MLALGKLGAGELNFSSDVDLIVLHDTHNAPFDSRDAVQPFLSAMTRDLIRLLSTTTRMALAGVLIYGFVLIQGQQLSAST